MFANIYMLVDIVIARLMFPASRVAWIINVPIESSTTASFGEYA